MMRCKIACHMRLNKDCKFRYPCKFLRLFEFSLCTNAAFYNKYINETMILNNYNKCVRNCVANCFSYLKTNEIITNNTCKFKSQQLCWNNACQIIQKICYAWHHEKLNVRMFCLHYLKLAIKLETVEMYQSTY